MPEEDEITPESLVLEMLTQQEVYAIAVDKLWQKHMKPFVDTLGEAKARFKDEIRKVERQALRFGKLEDLNDLHEKLNKDLYILGALFVGLRDEQVRERGSLPDGPKTIRVDKGANETKAIVAYDLSLADEAAIKELTNIHTLWFTDKTGAVYLSTGLIEDEALTILREGKSGIEIGEALKKKAESHYGIGKFAEKGASYWAGVAEHAATTAGISGQLRTLKSLGWEKYVIVNPVDERTTKVCQAMNGKTLFVDHGISNLEEMLSASTPEDVKKASPFVLGGSAKALEEAAGIKLLPGDKELTKKQSLSLSKSGFALPPYHFRCRSFVDISFKEP